MDSDDRSAALPSAQDYSQLNDAQLRSAIRYAEKRLRSVEEDHVVLQSAYRDEINAMRRHLLDRVLKRVITAKVPVSHEQRGRLCRILELRGMGEAEVMAMIRSATEGRTDRLDELTEVEAMALLLRLKQGL